MAGAKVVLVLLVAGEDHRVCHPAEALKRRRWTRRILEECWKVARTVKGKSYLVLARAKVLVAAMLATQNRGVAHLAILGDALRNARKASPLTAWIQFLGAVETGAAAGRAEIIERCDRKIVPEAVDDTGNLLPFGKRSVHERAKLLGHAAQTAERCDKIARTKASRVS